MSDPKKTVAVVIGTRPEAIKMLPVIRELRRQPDLQTVVLSTGQHREMLDQILRPFDVKVDHEMSLMEPNQSLYRLSAKAIVAFEEVLRAVAPDLLLVQGDTTTAMLGALCAAYGKIPIGHVEAGLRTNNKHSPFPEEINRRLITVLADLHFAPTAENRQTLLDEGVPAERIHLTGNTGIDALFLAQGLGEVPLPENLSAALEGRRLILVTVHRRESFGPPMEEIFGALADLANAYPQALIVYPVHLNPNVQAPAQRLLGNLSNVRLVAPLEYLGFVHLMARAELILTDSGGVQEEAPSLGVPVLVLRNETERGEAIRAGLVRLAGTRRADIVREARAILDHPEERARRAQRINPYGDGQASQRIVRAARELLSASLAA